MDETTIKVMAWYRANLQMQVLAMASVLSRPDLTDSPGRLWATMLKEADSQVLIDSVETGVKQIRLTAQLFEEKDPERRKELLGEMDAFDMMIAEGLQGLWPVPPHQDKTDSPESSA